MFRRNDGDGSAWSCIAELDAEAGIFLDPDVGSGTYSYTAIPVRLTDGEKTWGNIDYNGLSVEVNIPEVSA